MSIEVSSHGQDVSNLVATPDSKVNPMSTARRTVAHVGLVAIATVGLAGCSGDTHFEAPATSATAPSSASTTPTGSAPAPGEPATPTPTDRATTPAPTAAGNGGSRVPADTETLAAPEAGFTAALPDGWTDILAVVRDEDVPLPGDMDPTIAEAARAAAGSLDWMVVSPDFTATINILADPTGQSAALLSDPEAGAEVLEGQLPDSWDGGYQAGELSDGTPVIVSELAIPGPDDSVAATRQRAFAADDVGYYVTLSVTAAEPTSAQLEALDLVSRSLLDDNVNPG